MHLSSCPLNERDHFGCSSNANAVIMAHNDLLQRKLEEIRTQYSDCMVIYADYWSAYQTILSNYKKYQFEEPFKACCGAGEGPLHFDPNRLCGSTGTSTFKDSNKYINWDGVHFTEAMHQHLSDLFFNQNFCKPSFAEMTLLHCKFSYEVSLRHEGKKIKRYCCCLKLFLKLCALLKKTVHRSKLAMEHNHIGVKISSLIN